MPGILQSQIPDIVRITREEKGTLDWTDATLDEQELYALDMYRDEMEMQQGGSQIEPWDIMVNPLANARVTKLFDEDIIEDTDQFIRPSIGWRMVTGGYPIERRLLNMNRNPYKIVNMVQAKRVGALVEYAEMFEVQFWTQTPSTDDGLTPFGLRYWCVKNVTGNSDGGTISGGTSSGEGDFLGNQPWSGTNPGGVSHARHKNWTNKYTSLTEDDGLQKLWFAVHRCKFKSAVSHPDAARATKPRWSIYCRLYTKNQFVRAARQQNDNLGFDLARGTNEVVFLGIPIYWVPKLDYDSDYPIYGIDWNALYPVALEGEWMVENEIDLTPGQHTVARVHIDCTHNLVCKDRRRLFVLSTGNTI